MLVWSRLEFLGNWNLIEGAVVIPIDQSAIDERRDDLRAFEEFLELSNIAHESKLAYIYIQVHLLVPSPLNCR